MDLRVVGRLIRLSPTDPTTSRKLRPIDSTVLLTHRARHRDRVAAVALEWPPACATAPIILRRDRNWGGRSTCALAESTTHAVEHRANCAARPRDFRTASRDDGVALAVHGISSSPCSYGMDAAAHHAGVGTNA